MVRGRKPNASKLNELTGTYAKNPKRRNENEPKAPDGEPGIPDTVSSDEVALAKWKHVCAVLDDLGLLTTADCEQLELYCLNESLLSQCWNEMKSGIAQANGRSKAETVQLNKCMDRRLKLMAELGLTTSARARLSITPKPDLDDPVVQFFAATQGKRSANIA